MGHRLLHATEMLLYLVGLSLSKEGYGAGHLGEGYGTGLSRTSIGHFHKGEARELLSEALGRGRNDSVFEGAVTQLWKTWRHFSMVHL